MGRLRALATATLLLAAFPGLAATAGEGADRDALLGKGMEQHDAGSFKSAIESFQQALKLNPRDATALYEIAHSYVSLGDFKNCLTYARRSVDILPSAMSFNLLARCQDELGDAPGTLATFTAGLVRYPGDVQLNLNYAVILSRQHRNAEAKEHLRVAVNADPYYATPYLTYAGVLAGEQNAVGALYMWVRFLMLEPGTPRSRSVALYVKELLVPSADAQTGKRMTIRLATGNDPRDDFPTNPKIPAFTLKVPGKSEERKPADQFVSNAQLMFAVIADSIARDTPRDRQTFVWQNAGVPITDLERAKLRETFLYYVAGVAGLDGAGTWLDAHTSEFEALKVELARRN